MRIKERLQKQSIKSIILASVGVPLAAVMLLAGSLVYDEAPTFSRTAQIGRLMELVDSLGVLVHEQQKERGATSIFLNSKGAQFGPELAKQREATEGATARLASVLATPGLDHLGGEIGSAMEAILATIGQRPDIRARVDAQEIPVGEALGYYTAGNGAMLTQISRIGGMSSDAEVTTAVNSFVAFLAAKERAGIERAIASGGFAAGAFDTARLLALQRLISQQEMGFDFFLANADPAHRAAFEAMRALDGTQQVWRMRDIAFAYPETGNLQGLQGKDFFAASTERINAMKGIEEAMSADIARAVEARRRASLARLATGLLATAVLATLLLLMLRTGLRCILDTMSGIAGAARTMSEGDLDAVLPQRAPPELAAIITSLARFRDSIVTGRADLERVAAERGKAEARAAEEREANRRAEVERQQEETARAEARLAQERRDAQDIAQVVNACARGDFSQRLGLDGKEGAIAEICNGVNRIGEVADQGLSAIRVALDRLADGDLTYRMDGALSGVFAEIAEVMDRTTANLGRTLSRVSGAAVTVNGSAEELSTATDDLARRSERNAAMLEETAASLEQMSSSVGKATSAAVTAKTSVDGMSARAAQGNEVVQSTIVQMEEISKASAAIEKVLGVIDDIAFQTNLLALNAGVEAARAGEAGRGFAVVASEVRALAQRSSDSAREIADMISRSAQSVQRGVEMAANSGEALRQIVTEIGSVSGAIDQIAATFEEAKLGISEISQATTQLDRTTQQNAAMFEETNAAIQTLDGEAKLLSREMAGFRFADLAAGEVDSAPPIEARVA
ncbi:methyl-accepting chemotaxis protein [Poseidonocella sp. HB161398]|uniref:methyl-accepting chemotaxis protein n=1 Tax=Poseidonocella sp. HB161398 TaxID=2320855 RepID=UPI0014869040|nr:methyl-accepting chemotaxis protein [Poseidonocella sp. HB161398]